MPLIDANGRPLGLVPQAQQPQPIGFAVFRKIPGGLLAPLVTPKGDFAIIPTLEGCKDIAVQLANHELIPNKDQKVVTPMLKSSEYILVQLLAVGLVQAQVKNPDQLLAPEGKLNG